jgi:PBSX family phage terminase large subunit
VASGKTICSTLAFLTALLDLEPGEESVIFAKTFESARKNILSPMKQMLGDENVVVRQGSQKAIIMGREVAVMGAADSTAADKIQGRSYSLALCDELILLGEPSPRHWWDMLLSRMRGRPNAKIIATTNPGSPTSFILTDFLEKCRVRVTEDGECVYYPNPDRDSLGVARFDWVLRDNVHLDEGYIRSIEIASAGAFYENYVLGRWKAPTGVIYPLTQTENTVQMVPEDYRYFANWTIGFDHGMTNPCSAVLVGAHLGEERLVVANELRIKDQTLTVSDQAKQLHDWIVGGCGGVLLPGVVPQLVVDPAAKPFHNEWKRLTGTSPKKADNSVLEGITDVSSLIANKFLVFDERVVGTDLWRELGSYRWKEEGKTKEEPIKLDDHGPDALRYAIRALRRPVWGQWRAYKPTIERRYDRMFDLD